MKLLSVLILTLITAGASAYERKEKITDHQIKVTIMVHDLGCFIQGRGGESLKSRTNVELRSPTVWVDKKLVELPHRDFRGVGCDLKVIDKLIDDSKMSYWAMHDVPSMVRKHLLEDPGQPGTCYYWETLKIDLGKGIVLESTESEMRKCNL